MAKKKQATSKSTSKALKKAKAVQKIERKEQKNVKKSKGKGKDSDDDDDDLEGILEKMRREWEEAHTVTEELVEGPPSRRANATLTACPNGNHLWCIGGEFFSDDGKADEWRKFVSPTCPGPRSAHAVVATPAAGGKIFLFGGYCKEYAKGKRPVGVMLEDTWFLNLSIPALTESATGKSKNSTSPLTAKWERRKRPSYAPSIRSGCTMTLWANKNTGILFGGVTDEDRHEETLESVFWNDLYGYQIPGKGKWVSMALKRPKKKGGGQKKKKIAQQQQKYTPDEDEEEEAGSDLDEDGEDGDAPVKDIKKSEKQAPTPVPQETEIDPDDPNLTTPLTRYNTMLAVLRNTLYMLVTSLYSLSAC
ncbi:hypothetical protein H0H93_012084 [Arthromyces matolae]|nr:hypothetical protein H0H93_012084 [Arthromyces matolae]